MHNSETQYVAAVVKTRNRKNKIIIFVFAIFLMIVAVVGYLHYSKNTSYNNAIQLYENGNYEEAKILFDKLSDYKDSSERSMKSHYALGISLMNSGEFKSAKECFLQLKDISYEDSAQQYQECDYLYATELRNQNKYIEAIDIYEKLGKYKDSAEQHKECHYLYAAQLSTQKQYNEAIEIYQGLKEYKDSKATIEQIKEKLKYQSLNASEDCIWIKELRPQDYEYRKDYIVVFSKIEDIEKYCEETLYTTWFFGNQKITIDKYLLNNKPYSINRLALLGGAQIDSYLLEVSYLDTPDEHFYIEQRYAEESDLYGQPINVITFIGSKEFIDTNEYLDITQEEYDALVSAYEEDQAKIPKYSNQAIINRTFGIFKDRINRDMYQSTSYSDAYVEYDYVQKLYTCTMIATHCTNIFDIFGTSNNNYFVTIQFLDTGLELTPVFVGIS